MSRLTVRRHYLSRVAISTVLRLLDYSTTATSSASFLPISLHECDSRSPTSGTVRLRLATNHEAPLLSLLIIKRSIKQLASIDRPTPRLFLHTPSLAPNFDLDAAHPTLYSPLLSLRLPLLSPCSSGKELVLPRSRNRSQPHRFFFFDLLSLFLSLFHIGFNFTKTPWSRIPSFTMFWGYA